MRRSLLVLLAVAAFPGSATAAPVLMLGHHGQVTRRDDPFLSRAAVTPTPASVPLPGSTGAGGAGGAGLAHAARRPIPRATSAAAARTVLSELARLYRTHAINRTQDRSYVGTFNAALRSERHLSGTRGAELDAVTETLHALAVRRDLTASRLPVLFATLEANRRWWTTGSLLSSGQRVEFAGSQLVWEYYPGQGIQLQVLGTFGKADGLYSGGPSDYPAMEQLLTEMIPMAAQRGGGRTWEYYFNFDGGAPPWTSAMSQATGLEALTRAYQATGNRYYLQIAAQAMPIFTKRSPTGVNVSTQRGTRFLQYSFARGTSIINAFLQTLIGLYDYAHVSQNPTAARLFAAGDAEARYEVPHFDTGAWSLYQPGIEDTLDYHQLVTGFLQQLCTRTQAAVYCTTAQHFQSYLSTPPVLRQQTFRASVRGRRHASFSLRFGLSKVSHVGVVITQGSSTVFSTSASFAHGSDHFTVPAFAHRGTYSVRLAATDLAGNFARITGTLAVGS